MKGERTLYERPFRYAGVFIKDYTADVETIGNAFPKMRRCYICRKYMKNDCDDRGRITKRNYPYMGTFKITRGDLHGNFHFKIMCRECAYAFSRGVIEMDGETYYKPEDFDEEDYKARVEI